MSIPQHSLSLDGTLKRGRPVRLEISYRNPFETGGVWLRGNLHCHAGGHTGPPEDGIRACQWYREHGFDFCAVRHASSEMGPSASQDGFIPVWGDEVQPGHMLVLGADPELVSGAPSPSDLVRTIHSKGGVSVLAHPFWSAWSWEDMQSILQAGLDGFEVANGCWKYAANGRSDQMWAMALNAGHCPAPVGGDDSHDLGDLSTGESWTGVLAGDRTAEAILDAIRERRTYASEGPEIRGIVVEEPGRVIVQCSPCRACYFSTAGWPVKNDIVQGDAGTTDRFELDLATSGYRIRDYLVIVLEDIDGDRAWSAPIDMNVRIQE